MNAQKPDALRLAEQYDYGDPVAHSNTWKAAGEYPAITTEFINKHAHPSQAAKLCRADWSGKDESSVETVHPEVIKLLHAYVDADRAMRVQAAPQPAPAPSAAADLIAALEEARSAIISMKVEAETAGQGDEQMMLEACETISNEGLQADMAIRAALASAPQPSPTPQGDSQPAPVVGTVACVGTGKTTLTRAIASALRAASTEADNVTAPAGGGQSHSLHPEKCPITGRPFFMTLDHPDLGRVPTYGGPYDSYTIPAPEGEPTDPWHERELRSERYDHDAGWWVEGGEPIPLRIVHEDVLFKLQEDAEAAVAPTPPTQTADSVLEDAARLDWLALAGPVSICVVIDRPHDGEVEVATDDVTGYGKTLREALDAARKQGGAT